MSNQTRYTRILLRHESTSCKAERELIKKQLQAERHAQLTSAVNLAMEKKHSAARPHYRDYREASKVLYTITGNDLYKRYREDK